MERSTTRRLFSAREKGIIIRSIQKVRVAMMEINRLVRHDRKKRKFFPDKDSFLTIIPCQDRLLPLLRLVGTDAPVFNLNQVAPADVGGKGVVDRSSSKTASPAPFLVNGQCTSGSCTKTPYYREKFGLDAMVAEIKIIKPVLSSELPNYRSHPQKGFCWNSILLKILL